MLKRRIKSKVKDTEFKKAEKRRQIHLIESDTQGHIFYHAENGFRWITTGITKQESAKGRFQEFIIVNI